MVTLTGADMARGNRGGRPKAGETVEGTRQVRLFADLAEMVSDILKVRPELTSAQLLDPLVRPSVVAMHDHYAEAIEKVRAAEAVLRRAVEQARGEVQEQPPPKGRRRGG